MYSTCLFCTGSLGKNRTVEHMTVGRRLAFDTLRGRLWVVCPTCRRWNLCPFDERWEALEECERLASDSLSVEGTGEVCLLRHRSGLSLVRLGRAPLKELLPWRFARSLMKRRRDYLTGAGVLGAGAVAMFGGAVAGGGALVSLLSYMFVGRGFWEVRYPVLRIETEDGRHLGISTVGARTVRVTAGEGGEPSAEVWTTKRDFQVLQGDDLKLLLLHSLPYVNEGGASMGIAVEAGREISDRGGVEAFLHETLKDQRLLDSAVLKKRSGVLLKLSPSTRVALEAATHIEQEDRTLGGELPTIISQWREEEPIAEIEDRLIEPPGWREFKARYSDGREGADAL